MVKNYLKNCFKSENTFKNIFFRIQISKRAKLIIVTLGRIEDIFPDLYCIELRLMQKELLPIHELVIFTKFHNEFRDIHFFASVSNLHQNSKRMYQKNIEILQFVYM